MNILNYTMIELLDDLVLFYSTVSGKERIAFSALLREKFKHQSGSPIFNSGHDMAFMDGDPCEVPIFTDMYTANYLQNETRYPASTASIFLKHKGTRYKFFLAQDLDLDHEDEELANYLRSFLDQWKSDKGIS